MVRPPVNWPAFPLGLPKSVRLLDYGIVIMLSYSIMVGWRALASQPCYLRGALGITRQLDFLPAPDTTRMRLLLWLSWAGGSC